MYNNMKKNEVLDELKGKGLVSAADNTGGRITEIEYSKLVLYVKCTEDIEDSLILLSSQMEKSAKASDSLSNKIFWLNIVLALATVIIAGCEVLTYLESLNNN